MRVCYLYGAVHATDGGVGFLRNLCSQLQTEGHSCCAILGNAEENLLDQSVSKEIHFKGDWSLNSGYGCFQNPSLRQLRHTLKDIRPDLVHIIYPSAYYGINGHIQALPAIWRDFPTVTTFWGLNVGRGSNLSTRATVAMLAWGTGAVAAHDFGLMNYIRWLCLGLRQVQFLPVGSNIRVPLDVLQATRSEVRRRHGLDLETRYIGYFGGFDPNMGVADLLHALRTLRDRGNKRLNLLLIGWQRHRDNPRFLSMRQKIAEAKLEDVILMTPYAPDREVAELLRAIDVCVFPFRHNSMGRTSLMAALNAEAPVILASSSPKLGPLEAAVSRVPPRSPRLLADAIEVLLNDPNLSRQLALRGHKVWEEQFSWPIIAGKHLQLYNTILS
jgi:glycosyltransferase involved in cell wall biosynthesis